MISVCAGSDARVSGSSQTLALRWTIEQPARFFDHLRGRAEIDYGFTVRSEDCTMLLGIFHQHACADGRDFEAAHYVAVAVGAAHEAEDDFGGAGRLAHSLRIGEAAVVLSGFRVLVPISAVQGDAQPGIDQSG